MCNRIEKRVVSLYYFRGSDESGGVVMSKRERVSIALPALSAACAAPPMKVQGDVLTMDAEILYASERSSASGAMVNDSFILAPYEVKDVDRDWNRTTAVSVASFSKEASRGGWGYTFVTPSGDVQGS
jgi:hypothetical protein